MNTLPMRYLTIALLCLFNLFHISAVASDARPMKLYGRSTIDNYQVQLDEQDRQWLAGHGSLRLGVSGPDNEPFEVTANAQGFEGITADYAALLGQLLGVPIAVQRYESRDALVHALKSGAVDLMGTANRYDATIPGLLLTSAYAEDEPVLVTRRQDGEGKGGPGRKLAMFYHYLPKAEVAQGYPDADVQLYPSSLNALSAVAFGQADSYLGNAISANHLINKNYLNNLELNTSPFEPGGIAFAVEAHNTRLLDIVDQALAVIPNAERNNILRRWNAVRVDVPGLNRLHFSASEQQWLDSHPRVKVAINGVYLPLTYFDEKGRLYGYTADVLAQVTLRTGLKFDVSPGGSTESLMASLSRGDLDMVATDSPGSLPGQAFVFSQPYLSMPYVLVRSESNLALNSLDDMNGKMLALPQGSALLAYVSGNYPLIRITTVADPKEALELVSQGKVDAASVSLFSARYLITHKQNDKLCITGTVGTVPAQRAFAVARSAPELVSILNKALLSITPEETAELTSRWRSAVVLDDSYWSRHRVVLIQAMVAAALLLAFALGWNAYLRRLISTRKKAEVALFDQVEFMRTLIDGTPHPIYVRDYNGCMVLCNAAYLEVFGVRREQVIGKTVVEGKFFNPEDARFYHDSYIDVMRNGQPRIQDGSLRLASGEQLTIYHWTLPYRGSEGEVTGMIGGWIDVSERHHLLESLQEARECAENANRAKTTFLATMSHEIRTPINAILGMLELAMKNANQGRIDRLGLEVASGAAQDLLELIGDILDIARIESGHLSLSPVRANLIEQINSVARIMDGMARQKRLSLELELDEAADCDVLIDPLRFKQIFTNLLSNAIKFTTYGEVKVILHVSPCAEGEALEICLRVEDTGAGISVEDQQRLFTPFTQASNNSHSARTGTGLGLSICRTLAEMMHGQLYLSSELGRGTQVQVVLRVPLLDASGRSSTPEPELVPHGHVLNVLVVDDYSANRLLLSQQLSYLGHRVRDAVDGAQGLRDWYNDTYDVVITDCNMPSVSGYELARAIRAHEAASGRSPCLIIGCTANAQPEVKVLCREAGMDDCLFKPVALGDLSACLAGVAPELVGNEPDAALSNGGEIDFRNLLKLTLGQPQAAIRLLDDLEENTCADMKLLLKQLLERDAEALSQLAHKVKGSARIIGAKGLTAACEGLEEACSTVNDDDRLLAAGDALQQAMERVLEDMDGARGHLASQASS
ncbi:transporter substrate-binding domain-containing protein [Pseudomonas entomophila]|uniref:ATP-binding protein n=1 Tax=Pseudomonas entomophila TaxID=312306 RepID=UPI0024073B1B|nr:transporter substrate-binding domain-containing protein [Pseudomonas entomophila]MDF9618784.1 transporter substrate-binding domain-containing protein [Pseudomonas entomophila]